MATQHPSGGVTDPRISRWLMIATYVIAGFGLPVGFATVYADPPSLTIAALMTVGAGGILSFLRHAVFHRSDAARMGWDYGTTNAFQIETGLANLAWGLVAVGAVIFGWGLAVEGASFLVFGIYMIGASVAQVIYKRGVPMAVVSLAFGGMMTWIGLAGIAAA
ncbi:MAG: DUF6790 family protein [Candidatus Nanopelagicales bacterium]